MINIDNVLVNEEIINFEFTCDLKKCKGACCTMESNFGAPLEEDEIKVIYKILDDVKEYLSVEHWNYIKENGFWEEKHSTLMTKSLYDKACVFVYFEEKIAKCAIEKAYFDGKIKFRKPISCHLFPIRITDFGGEILRFEKYLDCESALVKGSKTKIKIVDFCKDALIQKYGEEWFIKLKNSVRSE